MPKAKEIDERFRADTWRGAKVYRCTTCSTTRQSVEAMLAHVGEHDAGSKPKSKQGGDEA